jgi:hypothetical protein
VAQGGCVGSGEGGELELGLRCEMEQSEEPVSSSNRRVHREEREGNGGGGSARCRVEERKWERERGLRARRSTARDEGGGPQWPLAIKCGRWHCCANKGEQWGVSDAALGD